MVRLSNDKQLGIRRSFLKGWATRSALVLAMATTVLAGCQTPEEQATTAPDETNVATEEIAENPAEYVGQTVTVRSEPIEKISPSTFTVEDEQFFGSDPILVVNASGEPFVFPEEDDTEIQITGEVRNFVFADIEREYNLGLEENAYVDYENQPALIAQSIAISPDPGEISSDPEQYYNEVLAVTGEIEEIQGPNVFSLEEDELFGGEDLLVLRATPAADLPVVENGETVAVTGRLQPFVVADIERDYDFNWDTGFEQQLEAEYSDRPVLIADDIYPSAIPEGAQ